MRKKRRLDFGLNAIEWTLETMCLYKDGVPGDSEGRRTTSSRQGISKDPQRPNGTRGGPKGRTVPT